MLAFCEAVFWRSAFATRYWFAAFSVVMGQSWLSVRLFCGGQHSPRDVGLLPRWDSRAFNGDDQCWLSPRLLCRGTSAAA